MSTPVPDGRPKRGGQGGLVTPAPTYHANVSVPKVSCISVICPVFRRGNCLTRTTETVASGSDLRRTLLLDTRVNRASRYILSTHRARHSGASKGSAKYALALFI